jgi:hypothetical protein
LKDQATPGGWPVLKKYERLFGIVNFAYWLTWFGHDAHRQWKLRSVHRSPPVDLRRLMTVKSYALRIRDIKPVEPAGFTETDAH